MIKFKITGIKNKKHKKEIKKFLEKNKIEKLIEDSMREMFEARILYDTKIKPEQTKAYKNFIKKFNKKHKIKIK